jgi:hypothetical protein
MAIHHNNMHPRPSLVHVIPIDYEWKESLNSDGQ